MCERSVLERSCAGSIESVASTQTSLEYLMDRRSLHVWPKTNLGLQQIELD